MHPFRKKLRDTAIFKFLSSIKITVVCLILLFILTFWGTVAQVDQGLYQAQQTFFNSWYFLVWNFLPFPGAQLILWVLFINLTAVSITRFVYAWSHLGITITHMGLLIYFVAAFVTLQVVQESNITLLENEGSNLSSDYHQWELALWKDNAETTRTIHAHDVKGIKPGETLEFPQLNLEVAIENFYSNSQAYTTQDKKFELPPKNASGIKSLKGVPFNIEPEQNLPGGMFVIKEGDTTQKVLLYGGESQPTSITVQNEPWNISLRRKRYELPFTLTLKDFRAEFHPGTETAKSYESLVEVNHQGLKRETLVYMNEPLVYKDYTFYQAAYSIDQLGRERSTLAVVKNSGKYLPYIATFVTFAGLVIHFLMMGFQERKRKQI